jgi:hypothetical protein
MKSAYANRQHMTAPFGAVCVLDRGTGGIVPSGAAGTGDGRRCSTA